MTVVIETLAPGVRQIRIDRPQRMNALGVETVQQLQDAIASVADARVVLIRGRPGILRRRGSEGAGRDGTGRAGGA